MSEQGDRARWEYLSFIYERSRKKIVKTDPEYARLPSEERARWDRFDWKFYWWRQHKIYTWRPGATKPREQVIWEEGDESNPLVLDLLNELGREGWEIIAVTNDETTMTTTEYKGWPPPVAWPVLTRFLLKRPMVGP